MHNARLSDPLDPIVKQIKKISKKTGKTDDDFHEMARLEWLGGIYYHEELGPVIPALNIHACLVEAARLSKAGKKVERGLFIDDLHVPLRYDGPRELDALSKDENFVYRNSVKVMTNRVMRSRPMFRSWQLVAHGMIETSTLDLAQLIEIANTAGSQIGLCDSRPAFGRFIARVDKVTASQPELALEPDGDAQAPASAAGATRRKKASS